MRVESKVTPAVGAGRDEAWFEEGMNKVALLIKRLDDLPLIQRIVQNFAPRGSAVGLETGVGAGDCLKSLSALALQPRSIVAGSLPVNKAATALLYRLRERGTRDVFTEQVRQMEAEAKLEEEKRMKELDTRLPEHDKLAVMLQAAFQRQKEREAALGNSYTLEMMRMAFVEMLGRLHPGEAGCSDCTLRLFMQGKYHIAKSKTISSRKWIKWRHAIYNLCLSMNGGVEPKQNAAPVS